MKYQAIFSMKKRDYLNDKNADGILVKVSPKETICMKYQASFSVKNKKTIINVCRMIKRTVLIHCSLETPQKKVIGKQCRPRSDAAFCGV